jgi:hypothetical protein
LLPAAASTLWPTSPDSADTAAATFGDRSLCRQLPTEATAQEEASDPDVEALWSCLLLRLRRPYVNGGGGRTKIRCMLQAYISNISDILDACCKYFIRMFEKWIKMLQWAIYVCFKCFI